MGGGSNSHLQTWPLNRSTGPLGNTCQANWRPRCLLTDMGALLSSKTDSKTPLNCKSPWHGKLSKHDLEVSSEARELSQLLHLATILRVNPPVNNLRLRRGVTLKNNPNNTPAMSLYSFSPWKDIWYTRLGFSLNPGKPAATISRGLCSLTREWKGCSQFMYGS